MGADDRSGGGTDDDVGVGEVEARLGETGEHTDLPADAGEPSAAQDQCRTRHQVFLLSPADRPHRPAQGSSSWPFHRASSLAPGRPPGQQEAAPRTGKVPDAAC